MPLLFLPIILLIIGVVLVLVIGFSLFIGVALLHILIWPVLLGLLIWWLVRRPARQARSRRDWQDYLKPDQKPGPKPAQHVKEQPQPRDLHHDPRSDDWSDF
ncbi:hypothetical protein ACFQ3L_01340 [Lacticaseibacillus jixianensis]|uniref:Phage shock protein G n=1 Tax=Lacticaseibacillus jixianensis TaxID=2486012 RepID=A0ABW4B5E2_9LACO|nr:hypothetical protein [Lacticaseibacillus jixianensis]